MDISFIVMAALLLGLGILSIALTVGWVFCLIHAAQVERWGWFVVMLVFGVAAFPYFFLHFDWPPGEKRRSLGPEA